MRPRSVGALAAAAAVLTGYVVLFERDPDRPAIGPVFPRLAFSDIQEIELTAGQTSRAPGVVAAPVRVFKKEDGSWWIEKPAVAAHIPRVESIAYSLVELQRIADLDIAGAGAVFDAGGPEEVVRFRTRSGEKHRLEVGKDHPDAVFDLCYVRLDGQKLFLTRKSFKKNLQSRLDDLRSRALFPIPRDRVAKLEVSGEEGAAKSLHRVGPSGDFRFDLPAPAPASREKIARVLDDLNSLRAESFIRDEPGDLAPYGLERPRLTIALTDRDGARTAIEVGADAPAKGQVYVRWADRPFVMTAGRAVVTELERPAEQFYSEYVLQLGAEDITEVSVKFSTPERKDFTLRRSAAAEPEGAASPARKRAGQPAGPPRWRIEESDAPPRPADLDRLAILTSALKYLAIKRYIFPPGGAPGPAGAPPAAGVAVDLRTDAGGRYSLIFRTAVVPVEEASPGLNEVTSGDDPVVYRVLTRIPEELARGSGWYRNRRISQLDGEGLQEFEVSIREDSVERSWSLGKLGDHWALDDSATPSEKLDDKLARKVAALLSREDFQVEEWAPAATDLAAREIEDSRYRVRITLTRMADGHRGFTRLYLGQPNQEGGNTVTYWCRVNDPDLEKLPFLIDAARGRAILDLVDHLKEITKP
jgi:uncharacterized protein DUF4340